jgi:hypothetical protein
MTNTLNDGLFVTLVHFNKLKSLLRILGSTYICYDYCEIVRWALMKHLNFEVVIFKLISNWRFFTQLNF